MKHFSKGLLAAVAATACLVSVPAGAVSYSPLVVEGVTYNFLNPSAGNYTLSITGINAAADTRKGRYGVESFAFNNPTGFVSATGPAGYVTVAGGLNASGCSNAGNFFCFDGPNPAAVVLAANSSLLLSFTVNASGLATWEPDFKINWTGTENNYNNVSLIFRISSSSSSTSSAGGEGSSSSSGNQVPESSSTLVLLGLGILGIGFMRRRKQAA